MPRFLKAKMIFWNSWTTGMKKKNSKLFSKGSKLDLSNPRIRLLLLKATLQKNRPKNKQFKANSKSLSLKLQTKKARPHKVLYRSHNQQRKNPNQLQKHREISSRI